MRVETTCPVILVLFSFMIAPKTAQQERLLNTSSLHAFREYFQTLARGESQCKAHEEKKNYDVAEFRILLWECLGLRLQQTNEDDDDGTKIFLQL